MRICLCFLMLLFFVACSSKNESHEVEAREIKIDELQKDFKLPESLWNLIAVDETAVKTAHDKKPKEEKGGENAHGGGGAESSSAAKENQIIFVPLKVELTQKNEGVLKAEKFVIELPRGGGQIDLSQWTTEENGTFYIKFSMSDVEKAEQQKVFFLSQARKRKIGDELLGMGCNKFVQLGQPYFKAMKEHGLALNTTRNRHLSVSGGRWIFVAQDHGKTYLSHVTITDTNQKELFCGDSAWTVN